MSALQISYMYVYIYVSNNCSNGFSCDDKVFIKICISSKVVEFICEYVQPASSHCERAALQIYDMIEYKSLTWTEKLSVELLELHLTTSELWFGQEQEGILP